MLNLVQQLKRIDIVTLQDELSKKKQLEDAGGLVYLIGIGLTIDFTLTVRALINKTTEDPLIIRGSLSPSGTTFSSNNDLGDFKGVFTKDANDNPVRNRVVVDFAYDISVEANTTVSSSDEVDFTMNLTNAKFQTVFGDVGTQALDVNFQVVNLDFFRDFDAGGITFTNPEFNFIFENGFGFPLGIDFKNITAIGSEGQIVPLWRCWVLSQIRYSNFY